MVPEPILDRFLIDFGPIFGTIRGPNCVFSVLRHPRFPTNIDVYYIFDMFSNFLIARVPYALSGAGLLTHSLWVDFWDDF